MLKENPKYPGYLIGSDGTVWSYWSKGGYITGIAKQLKTDQIKGGYLRVRLRKSYQKYQAIQVAHLVLESFVGERPAGFVACHNDGNPTNNRVSNLRWDTRKSNESDKRKHGTYQGGENNPAAKLTAAQVREMRLLRGGGLSTYELSRRFNISRAVVSKIIRGELWRVA